MKNIIRGKIYVVGDNIDTDQIISAQYLNLVPTIPEEYKQLGSHAMCGLPDSYPPFVEPGSLKSKYIVIVAGRNFGCGSSREHAPIALGAAGIRAVVAESYARIFFRNAIATGELYPYESARKPGHALQTGAEVEIDLKKEQMLNLKTKQTFALKPLGAAAPVVKAGGLFAYAREIGVIKKQEG